jgi:hypothetical protein
MADQSGKRMKMPKKPKPKKVKPIGFGKKIGGGAKTAIEIRREKQRKMLESMD